MSESNQLLTLINRLRAAFIGRDEIAPFYGGVDLTPAAQQITLANNATVAPFVAGNNFAGLCSVIELTAGTHILCVCGGGTIASAGIAPATGIYSLTAGNAGTINIYYTGGTYLFTIENKTGASRTIIVAPIRVRAGA